MTRRKSTRGRKTTHRRKRTVKKGFLGGFLGGIFPKMNTNDILDVLKKGGLVAVGFLAGRELDKKVFKSDEKEGIKRFIEPFVTGGGGVILTTMKGNTLKYIGAGLVSHAAIKTAGLLMKKDLITDGILSGFEGFDFGGIFSGLEAPARLPQLPATPSYQPQEPSAPIKVYELGEVEEFDID